MNKRLILDIYIVHKNISTGGIWQPKYPPLEELKNAPNHITSDTKIKLGFLKVNKSGVRYRTSTTRFFGKMVNAFTFGFC